MGENRFEQTQTNAVESWRPNWVCIVDDKKIKAGGLGFDPRSPKSIEGGKNRYRNVT
jgi:hypothetical protein